MKKLAIVGASGHGKVIADIAIAVGYYYIDFFDDKWPKLNKLSTYNVVGNTEKAVELSDSYDGCIIAIGNAKTRYSIQQRISNVAPAIIHPSAQIGSNVIIGNGSAVMPGAIINADTTIGESCIINSGAVVEHDCVVGDYSHICPKAVVAGGCRIGSKAWIGIGASIIQLIEIGDYATVGAGAVVIKNVVAKSKVVGNPAKPI